MGAIALLLMLYGINLYSTVSNTVTMQHIQKSISELSANVENLDAQYLELSSRVTPDKLSSFDLAPGQVSYFISRSSSLGLVAVGGHEF